MSKKRNRKHQEAVKKEKKTRILFTTFILIALLVTTTIMLSRPRSIESSDGILATPVDNHDFGVVSAQKGTVSVELPLANIGEEDLEITFLDSSCGCTTAQIINDEEIGPIFGMSAHSKSPQNWKTVIQPGKQAKLKIYYDPLVHPDFRGVGTRVVSITTNAKKTPEKQIRIKVLQAD